MKKYEMMYFVCGSSNMNDILIKGVFDQGLYNKNNSIASSMMYVEGNDDNIVSKVRKFGDEVEFIIRIPYVFFNPISEDIKEISIPVLPIWKKVDNRFYLTNELIYGAYDKKTDTFIKNENYKELHNPVGLLFDNRQIKYFNDKKLELLIKFSKFREAKDYKTLMDIDLDKKIWDTSLAQYEKYFYDDDRFIK